MVACPFARSSRALFQTFSLNPAVELSTRSRGKLFGVADAEGLEDDLAPDSGFVGWAQFFSASESCFSTSESCFLSDSTALIARSANSTLNFTLSLLGSCPPVWMGGPDAPETSISKYVSPSDSRSGNRCHAVLRYPQFVSSSQFHLDCARAMPCRSAERVPFGRLRRRHQPTAPSPLHADHLRPESTSPTAAKDRSRASGSEKLASANSPTETISTVTHRPARLRICLR